MASLRRSVAVHFFKAVTVVLAAIGCSFARAASQNVILIISDDLGYGEPSCYNGKYNTPNIDALAASGVLMTDGYVSGSVCSPSRCGLLTGRQQNRFGNEFNPEGDDKGNPMYGLPLDQVTLGNRMEAAGYATALIGKWHLGQTPGYEPNDRGFQYFYGFLGGGCPYVNHHDKLVLKENRTDLPIPYYLTYAFTQKASEYIRAHRKQPFFLTLAYNAVHRPYEPPQDLLHFFPDLTGVYQAYAAMTMALDNGVGEIRRVLQEEGIDKRTMVIFLSDNGAHMSGGAPGSNGILRGEKGTMYEGGIRVPFIISYPGHLPAGSVYTNPISSLDIVPTAMAVVGRPVPKSAKLDGKNLMPYLDGRNPTPPHDELYWRMGDWHAVRKGSYKLVQTIRPSDKSIFTKLFNVQTDPAESTDLSAQLPDVYNELFLKYRTWDSQMMPARWVRRNDND